MKVGVIGSGDVAQTLASGFLKHGHEVLMGTREAAKLAEWQKTNPRGRIGSFSQAAQFGPLVVLAVKGSAAIEAVRAAGVASLAGKTVIDSCNPIADVPPTKGLLTFFTSLDDSLMERLQKEAPQANFVKAFNSVGSAQHGRSGLQGRPTDHVHLRPRRGGQGHGDGDRGGFRLGSGRHGRHRIGARDRTPVHALVHPRLRAQRMDPRIQDAARRGRGARGGRAGSQMLQRAR